MSVLDELRGRITDPHTLALLLRLVLDLTDGDAELSVETRLELQAELDDLTRGVL